MKPLISAIICTHHRPHALRGSIQSLVDQSLQKAMYEIIVVDNTESQTARSVVEEFTHETNIRYVHEPILGLSHARNTGYTHASGDFVAYIDDDATADNTWLELMVAVFKNTDADCVGGKIELALEGERPWWLTDKKLFYFGKLSCSETPIILNDTGCYLHGGNIAFRKKTLIQHGGFDVSLGRVGRNLISCEEIFVQKKIRAGHGICLYNPHIVVTHHVPKNRLTMRWFLKRALSERVSLVRMRVLERKSSVLKTSL